MPAIGACMADPTTGKVDVAVGTDAGSVGEVLTSPGPCPSERPWALALKRVVCERECSAERATLYYCILGGTSAGTCYKEERTANLYFASAGTSVPGFGACTEEEYNRALNASK